MKNSKKTFVILVALLVILGGLYFYSMPKSDDGLTAFLKERFAGYPNAVFNIYMRRGNAVRVGVQGQPDGINGEALGGGIYAKGNGSWVVVWEGNGDLPCAVLDAHNIPRDFDSFNGPCY